MKKIFELTDNVMGGYRLDRNDALYLLALPSDETPVLMGCAYKIKSHHFGDTVKLCSIVNAKSGNCSEDCAFCAQSATSSAAIEKYPLIDERRMVDAAGKAHAAHASCFGIVASGKSISGQQEINAIAGAVSAIRSKFPDMAVGASIGMIGRKSLKQLIDAGLSRIHCNIESSKNYFKKICTTHTYEDKLGFISMALEEKIEVCGGGLVGMGESNEDRADLALQIRKLGIRSVPLNFLNPIPGTMLADIVPGTPLEFLKVTAVFRFILPDADIRICGGREINLRSLGSALFLAGANAVMTGNYLTTKGLDPDADLKMIQDFGFYL